MICPQCLSIETEGSLRCRKCGAQLHTGLFEKPAFPELEDRVVEKSLEARASRASLIAAAIFALAVVVLILVFSQL